MFILITYDVDTVSESGNKRLRRVAKECQNYGHRVQNSVFECMLTEVQYILLKSKIELIINKELDSVRFYILGKNWNNKIEHIGKETAINVVGNLII